MTVLGFFSHEGIPHAKFNRLEGWRDTITHIDNKLVLLYFTFNTRIHFKPQHARAEGLLQNPERKSVRPVGFRLAAGADDPASGELDFILSDVNSDPARRKNIGAVGALIL